MKFAVLILAVAAAGAASAQTPEKPREKPFVFELPKDKDGKPFVWQAPTDKDGKPFAYTLPRDYAALLDKRDLAPGGARTGPKKAPPGELCLLRTGDERCPQDAQLIRKPFEPGDADLYVLDQQGGKTRTTIVPMPRTKAEFEELLKAKPIEVKPETPG
jgi:hypothetical protein